MQIPNQDMNKFVLSLITNMDIWMIGENSMKLYYLRKKILQPHKNQR